jgi:hypothetical protein
LTQYGIASAMGVKDAEAFGIGAAAGGYAAPFNINGVRDFLGSTDQITSLFSLGNTSYNSYVTSSVSGQITSMIGGIAAAIYDGNYQIGAYGANQVFTYNDSAGRSKKPNDDGPYKGLYNVYDFSLSNMPLLVAVSDAEGHLTFLSAQYSANGTFYNGESFADFVHQISGSDNAFATLTGTTLPSYDGANVSQRGQNWLVPGDWTDVPKYHGSGSIATGLQDNGVLVTGSDATAYTSYVADRTVESGVFIPPPKNQTDATVNIVGGLLGIAGGKIAALGDSTPTFNSQFNSANQPLDQTSTVVSEGGQSEFAFSRNFTPSIQPAAQVTGDTQSQLNFSDPAQTAQQFLSNSGTETTATVPEKVFAAETAVADSGASSAMQGALLRQQLAAEEVAGTRMPQSITGYTNHGLNQVISRDGVGVSPQAILDTWNNPTSITGQIDRYGGKFMLGGQNATIVVNAQGKIITAWPNGSAGFRIMP